MLKSAAIEDNITKIILYSKNAQIKNIVSLILLYYLLIIFGSAQTNVTTITNRAAASAQLLFTFFFSAKIKIDLML